MGVPYSVARHSPSRAKKSVSCGVLSQRATSGTVRGFHLGTYAVMNFKPFYTSAEVAYSRYFNETKRTVTSFERPVSQLPG